MTAADDTLTLRDMAKRHLLLAADIQEAAEIADPEFPAQSQMVRASVHVGIAQAAATLAATQPSEDTE